MTISLPCRFDGLPLQGINQLVRGEDEPTLQELEAIATALGTTAEMLNASRNAVRD